MPSDDELHAAHLANRVGIGRRQRRRGAEPGFDVAEPLARRRMIVLLHRIVFGMERREDHVVADGDGSSGCVSGLAR